MAIAKISEVANLFQNFHAFRITGTNQNGALGLDVGGYAGDKIFTLAQFTNRKVADIAVGDYHSLVVASGCTCMSSKIDSIGNCEGLNVCNKGPDVLAWGQNNYK